MHPTQKKLDSIVESMQEQLTPGKGDGPRMIVVMEWDNETSSFFTCHVISQTSDDSAFRGYAAETLADIAAQYMADAVRQLGKPSGLPN